MSVGALYNFLMQKVIKNIAIIYREQTPRALFVAKNLCEWIKQKQLNVFFLPGKSTDTQCQELHSAEKISQLDLVVVLGGDGTYLEAVRFLGDHQIPVLGVNMGSLGFLTEHKVDELYEVMELALSHQMKTQPVSLLKMILCKGKEHCEEFLALNDAVIERGQNTHLLNIGIYCDDVLVTETKADGMIIASATGSTAYNLAAGGPIMHPDVHAVVVTPICPHSLTTRPMLLPDDRVLSVRILGAGNSGRVSIDGRWRADIDDSYEIQIQRHSLQHVVLRRSQHQFFTILREKLKFGERN